MESRWSTGALLAALILGILLCLWMIARGGTTTTESLLVTVVLTILSILGSWIASGFYSERSFNKNLRVFALKASEKVTNLSNELDRLSAFLQQELEADDYHSPNEALLAKNSRIEAAVHVINTLKSVNDGSRSDWQGVIGDEIIRQREEQEEREEELKELIERVESLSVSDVETESEEAHEDAATLRAEVDSMKADLRVLASQVSGVPIRRPKPLQTRQDVESNCPQCSHKVQYRQRPKPTSFKGLSCQNCGARLYSQHTDQGFVLKVRLPIPEVLTCPTCAHTVSVTMDPMPGSKIESTCEVCRSRFRAYRAANKITIKSLDTPHTKPETATSEDTLLDEGIIERIRRSMPPQPWPHGAARQVASKLQLEPKLVSEAIEQLIEREVFKLQINGLLYTKDKSVSKPTEGTN
ncbi:MAG: hypothetical protein AABM67_02630 [Acidobacteriota bacterium]